MTDKSIWQEIYLHLKNKGVNVYSPSTKDGECTSPYVVVKGDGGSRHVSFSSNVDYYTLLCYVPKNQYSKLESYKEEVKSYMKDLAPMVKPNGYETSSYYDDTFKAHMVSVQYKNYKKL